jgi:hypothetical protein
MERTIILDKVGKTLKFVCFVEIILVLRLHGTSYLEILYTTLICSNRKEAINMV